MLQAVPSTNIARDQLTVYFNYDPRAIVGLQARLVRAYNPFGALPPGEEQLMELVRLQTTPNGIAKLHQYLSSRDALASKRAELADAAGGPVGLSATVLGDLTSWFALGGLLTPPRDHLFAPRQPGQPVGTGRNAPTPNLAGRLLDQLGTVGQYEGWLNKADAEALAYITLWARYEQLTKEGSMLTTADKPPEGAPKEVYISVQRTMRIVTLAKVLSDSINVASMREEAALITSPAFAPLLEYVSVDTRERVKDYATRLLALKVHPWIAEAERLRVAAKRYTEWGNASHTMGLSAGAHGMWQRLQHNATARDGKEGPFQDLWGFVTSETEGGFVATFLEKAREFFLLRDMMPQDMIAQAEAALGLTTPGAPPSVHLHGQTWKALVQTGSMASEPLGDVLSLMLRPRFALLNADRWSELVGNTDALQYNARFWVTRTNSITSSKTVLSRPDHEVPLFVQPQHPEHIAGYGLRELTPEMIRPMTNTEFFGDEDAVVRPFTLAGAASLLGFSSPDALAGSILMAKLGHLFVRQGNTYVANPDVQATHIFYSTRTRQPWRVPVGVPTSAMPYQTMAMDARTAPTIHDIEAIIIRTLDQPSMTAATFALADSAAVTAAKNLGVSL